MKEFVEHNCQLNECAEDIISKDCQVSVVSEDVAEQHKPIL